MGNSIYDVDSYVLASKTPETLVPPSPVSARDECVHRWVFLDRIDAGNWIAEIMACDNCGTIVGSGTTSTRF